MREWMNNCLFKQCIHKSWLLEIMVTGLLSLGRHFDWQNSCFSEKDKEKENIKTIFMNSPSKTAPRISATVAMIQACFSVKTLAPTLVPKTLATSFAPTPNARVKARIKPTIIIHSVEDCHSSKLGAASVDMLGKIVVMSGRTVVAELAQTTPATRNAIKVAERIFMSLN